MTRERRFGADNGPFNVWIRQQPELDAAKCRMSVSDLDAIISRNLGGVENWMFIECKQRRANIGYRQQSMFQQIDRALVSTSDHRARYRGFHLVQLWGDEIRSHDDSVFLDGAEIDIAELILFCRFDAPDEWYEGRPWLRRMGRRDVA